MRIMIRVRVGIWVRVRVRVRVRARVRVRVKVDTCPVLSFRLSGYGQSMVIWVGALFRSSK